ncbi:septum formation initiator family protein [Streptomyces sp. CWNU-1]|uniref:Septum formation initiator family protein n=2 Tax=Streptomyces albipurpureus TaxID=2897419 RepID=A0ABT0UV08_9ACTN|nr:septum formation initiator family protein [Streptomyces sp. CWNU-1]MCM2392412.1 septum formation initiator family protein [Streptomyces sp. CWNU-1]
MPAGPSSAARTPFVLLVVVLLGGGLIALLLLNSALNEGSFELSELKRKTTELTDEQQALQRDVDDFSAPDALERQARELGMVPGGAPAFINPDGTVRGDPGRASAEPSSSASADPDTTASPSASTTASSSQPARSAAPGAPGSPTGASPVAPPADRQASRPAADTEPAQSADRESVPAAMSAPAASTRVITELAKPTPTPPGR